MTRKIADVTSIEAKSRSKQNYGLTTSIICIKVKPKLNWSGSDSLTTGRSSVLYESSRSCSKRFSLYPAEQSARKETRSLKPSIIQYLSERQMSEAIERINSWESFYVPTGGKYDKFGRGNSFCCHWISQKALLINIAHLLLSFICVPWIFQQAERFSWKYLAFGILCAFPFVEKKSSEQTRSLKIDLFVCL